MRGRRSRSVPPTVQFCPFYGVTPYRRAWEGLVAAGPPRTACRVMVGLLVLAHERACEAELAGELDHLAEAGALPDLATLEARFGPAPGRVPEVTVTLPSPAIYDALLAPNQAPHGGTAMGAQR